METPVDTYWLFTIARKWVWARQRAIVPEIASLVAIDNGTTAPGQNSDEFGVTARDGGPDGTFRLSPFEKLYELWRRAWHPRPEGRLPLLSFRCRFRVEAGHDVRTALLTLCVDASHGYERIHLHGADVRREARGVLRGSEVQIERDAEEVLGLRGFTGRSTTGRAGFEGGRAGRILSAIHTATAMDHPVFGQRDARSTMGCQACRVARQSTAAADCRIILPLRPANLSKSTVANSPWSLVFHESVRDDRICMAVANSVFALQHSDEFHVLRWIVHPHERLPITDRTAVCLLDRWK